MAQFSSEITLLLVEDDDIDAMNIEREFNKQRISNPIVRAYDGIDALAKLRSGDIPRPYVILLDLQMPRMNGLEFLQVVREDPELKSSIIFVLTTSSADEDITASYKKNIAGYFVKDSTGENFLNVVHILGGYWRVVHLPEVEATLES